MTACVKRSRALGLCAALMCTTALAASTAVLAQETQADGRIVYPAAWFATFAPGDALDMAERVPGFSLEEGAEVRGFSGAAGNVVINGARPNIKSDSLVEVLRRIPVSQVVRMELVPGRLLGADYQSRPQVLNVVMTAGEATRLSGTIEVIGQRNYSGETAPSVNASAVLRRGQHAFNGAFRFTDRPTPDEGYDIFTLADGALVERRDKVNRYDFEETSLAGGWRWTAGPQTSQGLNGRIWTNENPLRHVSNVSGPTGPMRRDTIEQNPETDGLEVGGEFSRPLWGGAGKAVVLTRHERFNLDEVSLNRTLAGTLIGGLHQTADRQGGETLARATWSRAGLRGWTVEAGAETGLNTLESDTRLFRIAATGAETPLALPLAQVEVREVRSEAFVSGSRSLSDALSLEAAMAVEQSRLSVDGDAVSERRLTFIKPRAALEWRPGERWRLRLALDRTVSQLNFDDFVTSAELANDRVSSGNAEIEPERTWRLSGVVERKVWGDGQLRLTLFTDRIEQLVDRVPTLSGDDAPGNLGDARRTGFDLEADLPLDRLAVPKGRIALRWIVQDSDVTDPYTGQGRRFTGEFPWLITADFRQDLPARRMAWGVTYIAQGEVLNFRRNEIDGSHTQSRNFGVYAEYRPTARVTATITARNIFDRDIYRDRTFFLPDRRTLTPYGFDNRFRRAGTVLEVRLKRTFG